MNLGLQTQRTKLDFPYLINKTMGPVLFRLKLDGDVIESSEPRFGLCSRGVEQAMQKATWYQAISLASRLSPDSAYFSELAYVLAIEGLAKIDVPPRIQMVRVVLAELSRISSHLKYLYEVARSVETQTICHLILRDRERILDLFELLCGARFFPNFLRPGGICADVSEGFLDRTSQLLEVFRFRIKEYNDLFVFNQSFLKRAIHVGVLSSGHLNRTAASGPNARAAGRVVDCRKTNSTLSYEGYRFEVSLGQARFGELGDAYERVLVRVYEIHESLEIIRQALEKINAQTGSPRAAGVFQDVFSFSVEKGEALARVEAPCGELLCYVMSQGEVHPTSVRFRSPSVDYWWLLPDALKQENIEDLDLVVSSLQLSAHEVDK